MVPERLQRLSSPSRLSRDYLETFSCASAPKLPPLGRKTQPKWATKWKSFEKYCFLHQKSSPKMPHRRPKDGAALARYNAISL